MLPLSRDEKDFRNQNESSHKLFNEMAQPLLSLT